MSLLFLVVFACVLTCNEVEGRKYFKTRHGDIYDCVDFFKQPSFNHPMLKNHSFHPQMRPSFLPKLSETNPPARKNELKKKACPTGTVPIRRVTKAISQMMSYVAIREASGTYVAGVRTPSGPMKYAGGNMGLTVYNPPFVKPSAYSQTRMKISSGNDAIQIGWRVDPSLRGDNRTRQFIYIDAGQSHCFDAQCGFVITNSAEPLDQVLEPVTQPGGDIYTTNFNITRDQQNGNWWFMNYERSKKIVFGFWPKSIFTRLADSATDVEWAGEVYSPPGVDEPLMGSGYKPEVMDPKYVAYMYNVTVINESFATIDVEVEEVATDRALYDVKDEVNVYIGYKRLIYYGGARY